VWKNKAEQFGGGNAVERELIAWVKPAKILALDDVTD